MEEAEADSKHPRILVVDDDPTLQILFVEALRGIGEVVSASSVREARQVIGREHVDAVISDFRFLGSEEDGLSLFEWIRRHHPRLAERFLLITGLEPRTPPPCPVLLKPFLFEDLIARVQAMVGGHVREEERAGHA